MTELLLLAASALWLGILTSVSPCPLATNVAAISFIGRRLESPRWVLVSGLLYTVGRVLTYTVLGVLLVSSLLSAPSAALILQKYMNQILGPVLILIGMLLLEIISLGSFGSGLAARLQKRADRWGVLGALLLGVVFALSFCPVSAALFFGSLLTIAVKAKSGILLPAVYGIGTGLPVLAFAFLIAAGARSLAKVFDKVTLFERWARRVTGVVFLGIGIYYTLAYVFRVF
jgi:cytochrome c biogenesis protein CcdA